MPVLIDDSADIESAIASVVDGKSFDFGTVCSSEQTVVVNRRHRDRVWAALKANGAFLCSREQREEPASPSLYQKFPYPSGLRGTVSADYRAVGRFRCSGQRSNPCD